MIPRASLTRFWTFLLRCPRRLAFLPLACALLGPALLAAPASEDIAEFAQPDGHRFSARLLGDEWFHWHETADGYVIGRAPDGRWKYQRPRADRAGFETIPDAVVGRVSPASLGLRPRDLPPRDLLLRHIQSLRDLPVPAPARRPRQTTAPHTHSGPSASTSTSDALEPPASDGDAPPSSGPHPHSTNLRCIVILAAFNDHWDTGAGTVLATRGRPPAEYDALCNTLGYNHDGAVGSARDYFREVSYGRTDILFHVTPTWVRLPQNEAYYGDNANESAGEGRSRIMARDAVAAAAAAGFNFSVGDGDGDGWVDLLVVIHSGYSEAVTGNPSTSIWPRRWILPERETRNGKFIGPYATVAGLRGLQSSGTPALMRIGTLVHEMGHLFGLKDLYDVGGSTRGVGGWCLMANGSWGASGNVNSENRPTHLSAFSKSLLGYLDPEPVHSCDVHSLPRLASSPSAHLLRRSADTPEYFLVENRGGVGFDSGLPAGLLITHVNPAALSTENNSILFPNPALRVEEANGGNTLASSAIAQASHVWTSTNGLAGGFRDQTGVANTNAMLYQSHQYSRSDDPAFHTGIVADQFSAPGATMSYRLRTRSPGFTASSAFSDTGAHTLSWFPGTGAVHYELQQGLPTTATTLTDDAESLTLFRELWQPLGAASRSTLGNATVGGSACYEFAGRHTLGGNNIFMPEVRGLLLRQPITLTSTSSISFKYLSQQVEGYGSLRVQLSKNDGATWTTLGTYHGWFPNWTTVTLNSSALQSAGFFAGDTVRLRFIVQNYLLWGWSAFPAFGFALDDISLTNIQRAATTWTTLASAHASTAYPLSGLADDTTYRHRVRAWNGSTWSDWSPVSTLEVDIPATPAVSVFATTHPSEVGPTNGVFTLSRTESTATTLTVSLAWSGTATPGLDYQLPPASATFAVGQSTTTVTITPVSDGIAETASPETITLTVQSGSGYVVGSPSSATLLLADAENFTTLAPTLGAPAIGSTTLGLAWSFPPADHTRWRLQTLVTDASPHPSRNLYDGFAYTAGSNLIGQGGWTLDSGTGNHLVTQASTLSYPGLRASTGGSVSLLAGPTAPRAAERTFTNSANTTDLFYSLLLRVDDLSSLSTSWSGLARFEDNSATPVDGLGLHLRRNGATFDLGAQKRADSANAALAAASLAPGTTYFVVLRYRTVSGNHNDAADIWVNPASHTFGDASPPIPTASITTGPNGTDTTARWSKLVLAPPAHLGITLDEVRVGSAWGAVTEPEATTWGGDQILSAATLQTTLTGLAAGSSHGFRIRAENTGGTRVSAWSPTLSPNTAAAPRLADWRQQHFGTAFDAGPAADAADPDGDGLPNLLEYALGLDPTAPSGTGVPAAALNPAGTQLQLTFHRARAELTYEVLASSDLVTWTVIATNPGTAGQTVTVTDPDPASPRRFLRLRVTP